MTSMESLESLESLESMESMNIMLREELRFGAGSSAGVRNTFCFEIERICFTADAAAVYLGKKLISLHSKPILDCISSSAPSCAFEPERVCLHHGPCLHKSIAGGHDSVNRGAESVEPSCGRLRSEGAIDGKPLTMP